MIDLNDIKKNYAAFNDAKITHLAKKGSKGLRADVVPILIEEVKKRKLSDHLIQWINAERRTLSDSELQILKQKVKNSTCTICNQNTHLEGIKYTTIVSFLFGYTLTNHLKIVCSSCGTIEKQHSAITTLFLGWWSPSGFFNTLFALFDKVISVFRGLNKSNELIELYIMNNIGVITLENDSEEIIQQLLNKYNEIVNGSEV